MAAKNESIVVKNSKSNSQTCLHSSNGFTSTFETGECEPETVRAAVYVRVSSPNQKYNYSINEQIACCRNYIRQRGWTTQYLFIDEAESGGTVQRPKFQSMLERAKSKCFDVIVVWKLDRFCRSLVDLVNVERALRECGVSLCSVTEFLDTSSTIGRFNFRTIGSIAELETEIIGQRSRLGLHALAKAHKWPNPHPPIGYKKLNDGRLGVREKEAKLVRRIFFMYLLEKSMPQVAFLLNKEGILTKNRKEWTATAVRNVLTDEIYIGIYDVAGIREYVEEYRMLKDSVFIKTSETRLRYKAKGAAKPAVPADRKIAKIKKMFEKYSNLLKEG
jgi:site-specific DNA recombinase